MIQTFLLCISCLVLIAGCSQPLHESEKVAINCGSTNTVGDSNGKIFSPETGFFDGVAVPQISVPSNVDLPAICQSERYGMSGFWTPLPNGRYSVKLTFCESYSGVRKPGQRVFHVDVEGVPLRNVDPFAQAGGLYKPLIRHFDVHVMDEKLDIAFENVRQSPQINAIEITPIPHIGETVAPIGFDQVSKVPTGRIASIMYPSTVTKSERPANVYTPPGYDGKTRLPVLYLLHGGGEDQNSWRRNGRVAAIMNNLIAAQKSKPMIVVMPYGFVNKPGNSTNAATVDQRKNRLEIFQRDLVKNLVPYIDSHYATIADADHRALAGLSMGGGQVMYVGPRNTSTFSYLGVFAGGMLNGTFNIVSENFPDADLLNSKLKLFWQSCGHADRYISGVRRGLAFLNKQGVRYHWHSHNGGHNWKVWREALYLFAQVLFKDNQ